MSKYQQKKIQTLSMTTFTGCVVSQVGKHGPLQILVQVAFKRFHLFSFSKKTRSTPRMRPIRDVLISLVFELIMKEAIGIQWTCIIISFWDEGFRM